MENTVQVQLFLCSETASFKCAKCSLAAFKVLDVMTHLWSQEKAVIFPINPRHLFHVYF